MKNPQVDELEAALSEERGARIRAERWAGRWKRAALLHRGKVRLQAAKIERQRAELEKLSVSIAALRGTLQADRLATARRYLDGQISKEEFAELTRGPSR